VLFASDFAATVRYRPKNDLTTYVDTVLLRDLAVRTEPDPYLDPTASPPRSVALRRERLADQRVRAGQLGEHAIVTAILTAALGDTPFMAWLMPGPDQRRRTPSVYLGFHTQYALAHGLVDVVDDVAVALWVPYTGPVAAQEAYAEAIPEVGAETLARQAALDRELLTTHPLWPHHHLQFVAVRPGAQGRGLGTALLEHHHARLDRDGLPAYVEAKDPRVRALYQRLGYTDLDKPVSVGSGDLTVWPMVRWPVGAVAENQARTP
jgi:ribosomal protein S18 acetylase RimI-like enzyme